MIRRRNSIRTTHCLAYRAAQWVFDKLEDSWVACACLYAVLAVVVIAINWSPA